MNETLKNYICEKCGGDLKETAEGRFLCPYCHTEYYKEVSLPDELVLDLHSANRQRSLQKFEDALNEYDRIIASYPDCFDAYWGATLSDYGIQYEKDYDGRMIPTVHRFSETAVFENDYFTCALKYCKDEQEKARIEKSAVEIERIRGEIKKTVGTQEPYDIFLCYKETVIGGDGGFTPEFYWADELYRKLSGLGYRVFFAKQSLPAAKGDYEAHIFPALRSAKLMLILTTDVRHVESVWVKNEWSRFIRFSRENASEGKRFKVVYRGFKPEKLPRELRKEQALNQDGVDWFSQLLTVVEDTFRDKKKEEEERLLREKEQEEEKRRRESEEQAERFAKMLEQERQRWAAEEQKRQEENRKRREEDERIRQEDAARKSREDDRIRELERQLAAEKQRHASASAASQSSSRSEPTKKTNEKPQTSTKPQSAQKIIEELDPEKLAEMQASNLIRLREIIKSKNIYPGEVVKFGAYKQGTTGRPSMIEWNVIDVKDGKICVISKNALECMEFEESGKKVSKWETCAIRKWLNETFFNAAFSDSEKAMIPIMPVKAHLSPTATISPGNDTEDKVFLLSTKEVKELLTFKDAKLCAPSEHALASINNENIAFMDRQTKKCNWWLRTPGDSAFRTYYVDHCGNMSAEYGYSAGTRGIRPAMWIALDVEAEYESRRKEQERLKAEAEEHAKSIEVLRKLPFKIGTSVFFGSYYQDSAKKKTPIEWLVLDKTEEGNALLVSKYALDCKKRHDEEEDVVWENCFLRSWLNSVFFKEAFDEVERAFIPKAQVFPANTSPIPENDTNDCVFLLGEIEYKRYIKYSDAKKCKPTSYAMSNGAKTEKNGCKWWLRSNGYGNKNSTLVDERGDRYERGFPVNYDGIAVRPAIWFNFGADKNKPNNPITPPIKEIDRVENHSVPGGIYNGVAKLGVPHGEGQLEYTNGEKYNGFFADGKPSGKGTLHYKNGDFYTGDFLNGKRHGKGTLCFMKKKEKYDGDFAEGEMTGIATYTHKNGDVYEGSFVNGQRHGKGKLTYKNGNVYEGDWKNNKCTGKGRITYTGGDVYEGDFVDDRFQGSGKMTFANGDVYEGEWSGDRKHGRGKMTYVSGDVYEGDFAGGVYSGAGRITYKNGDVYEGQWELGQQKGKGKMTYFGGKTVKGKLINGVFKKTLF